MTQGGGTPEEQEPVLQEIESLIQQTGHGQGSLGMLPL
jgi:hypothetical protein